MKQLLISPFFFICILIFSSCQKEKVENIGAKTAAEAEFRLASVKKWIITDAKINEVYILKDRVLLDPEQDGIAEWLAFDTDSKTVEVKYPYEDETVVFDYVIDGTDFKVIDKDGYEELMHIKSGSVFVDHFTLTQTDGADVLEVTLKVK